MDIFHVFTILIILFFSFASLSKARNLLFHDEEEGITLDLIHRDSPISPLYDSSRSGFDLIHDAFERSKYRVMKTSSSDDIVFHLNRIPGEYIIQLSIGTPSFKIQMMIDTVSDLTWTPCESDSSANRNHTIPVFNPVNSKSFKYLSCNSSSNATDQCLKLHTAGVFCSVFNLCFYYTSFFQGIETDDEGELSSDIFTFESSANKSISIKNYVFGCGYGNRGGEINGTTWGHFSLSNGPLSIVNQLKQKKFSYCLVPSFIKSNITSKINFGANAIVAGPGTITLPLYETSLPQYCLRLEAIKVDNKILSLKPFIEGFNISIEEGTARIDTALTKTYFNHKFYQDIKREVKAAIAVAPSQEDSSLCYKITPDLKLPTITLSFVGGDVVLPSSSTFVEAYKGQVCLAFDYIDNNYGNDYGYDERYIVLGNLVQENFLVGYDLVKHQVSFKPTDCTKQ